MTTFEDRLHEAMAEMLKGYNLDVVKVTGFEEYEYSGGYCETCYYDSVNVRVFYEDSAGGTQKYNYYGDFAELITDLTRRK